MSQIRFGVLGAARIAHRLVRAMNESLHATPVAVAARDPSRAREFADRHGLAVYADYAALVSSPALDAVYIPLPNHLHAPWALRTLEAGKHVLLEKPFTMNGDEATLVLEAAAARGLVAMEAFMYRYHPQFTRALEIVRAGTLGELRFVRANFGVNLGNPEDFRWRRSLGGGALFDVGCYCVNALLLVAGATPTAVWARQTRGSLSDVPEEEHVDVDFIGGLEFGDLRASFDCSFRQARHQRLEIIGRDGVLTLNEPFLLSEHDTPHLTLNAQTLTLEPADRFRAMIEHFSRVALGLESPRFDAPEHAANSVAQMRALDALREVAVEGAPAGGLRER